MSYYIFHAPRDSECHPAQYVKNLIALNAAAKKLKQEHPSLRVGQAIYNAAINLWPEKTAKLAGTKFDCFYLDSRILEFVWEVCKDGPNVLG